MIAIKALNENIDDSTKEDKGINKNQQQEATKEIMNSITQIINYYNGEDTIERVETPATKKYARKLLIKKFIKGLGVAGMFSLHVGGLILINLISKRLSPDI